MQISYLIRVCKKPDGNELHDLQPCTVNRQFLKFMMSATVMQSGNDKVKLAFARRSFGFGDAAIQMKLPVLSSIASPSHFPLTLFSV